MFQKKGYRKRVASVALLREGRRGGWREMVVSGEEARGGRIGLPFLPPLEKSARAFGLQLWGSVLKYGY